MNHTITLPDVGDLDGVEIVEIFVKAGDSIEKEQTMLTLEGSKASMEIPAPMSGVVKEVLVKVGDAATEAMTLMVLTDSSSGEVESAAKAQQSSPTEQNQQPAQAQKPSQTKESDTKGVETKAQSSPQKVTFTLPDVGDLDGVEVVEVFVKVGDQIKKEQTIITLEGSKASMEIPSPHDGTIEQIMVKVGDSAALNMPIAVILTGSSAAVAQKNETKITEPAQSTQSADNQKQAKVAPSNTPEPAPIVAPSSSGKNAHASPSVRKFARVLGVDLSQVQGSGEKNRISKTDVEKFVKTKMQAAQTAPTSAVSGSGIPPVPKVDFEKFGPVEYKKLNKIKQISSAHLHASWLNIPHVTQFAEFNAESLEQYRLAKKVDIEKQGYKLTPLILIMKAVVASLKQFPNLNSSLVDGQLVIKKYYNIGIAVDTVDGLVVPVVRNVDEKSVFALAKELTEISQKARDKKLNVTDMSGGTFTISNLGGLGAGPFTPIVNAPEVAILGLSRSFIKPVFVSGYFMPQLTMPISLSYDHRVIDGAEGARFMSSLADNLISIASVV